MSRLANVYLARFAVLLDGLLLRHAHRIPGVVSGGSFYRGQQSFLRLAMWAEPGAYVLQVAGLEVILDRR